MPFSIDEEELKISCDFSDVVRFNDLKRRRFYLYGGIEDIGGDCGIFTPASKTGEIVEWIMEINREDIGKEPESREPIILYINSPGGDLNEGFALIDTISLSKTPIHTVNIGEWSSMSFLIGISGHKRYSLPHAKFLLHDGSSGAFGTSSKVQDLVKFEERYENEVVKPHVLAHSNMKSHEYDALSRVEYYLLPNDALERGFIDEVVTDIDAIL